MENLLEQNNLIKPLRIGDVIEGKIIGKGRSAVFLDLGSFGAGIIFGREFQEAKDKLKDLKIGDSVFAKIMDMENEEGYVELSLNQAHQELGWESLKQNKEKNEILKVKITGANKGGLLAEVAGTPAFLPVSQLSSEHYPRVEDADPLKILRELQNFIGQELEVTIFDLSQKEGKLILSEKSKETEKIRESLKNYQAGDIVEGKITGIVNFGVFIVFGENLEGLCHISELDWSLVQDPSEIVQIGQSVKAKIIEIANDRVFLSLKALKEDPWKNIEEKYKKGDEVSGKVTKINPFGAFVQISPKIQGLCHISEFGTKIKMEDVLKIGKKYEFQILSIDPGEHRMSLKLAKAENIKEDLPPETSAPTPPETEVSNETNQ